MQRWMSDQGWWSDDEEKALQERLRREVLEAMKRAEKRPPPPLDTLVTDVYAEVTPALQQQLDALKAHIRRHPEAYPKGARFLDPELSQGGHSEDAAVDANDEGES